MKRASEERRLAAERLAGIVDGITEGYVALDGALVVTDLNAGAERLFDRQRSQVTGKPFLDAFPNADRLLEQSLREVLSDQRARSVEARLADGPSHAVPVRLVPHAGGVSLLCPLSTPAASSRGGDGGKG
jgi:PAS domain-containing protein